MQTIRRAGLVLALALAACGTSRKAQLERVAKDWCQTIRASQVIPVYPLTEDLIPGDVFLVELDVSKQHKQYEERGFLPLDNHLTRLRDVSYVQFYERSFVPGAPQPKNWLEQDPPFSLKAPEAAFPSYTFTATRSAGLNLAVPVSGVPVGLSLLGAQSATGSITISDAKTYGLPIVDLTAYVELWATANRTFLAQYASTEEAPRYLRIVSRVYLTGGVDVTLQDARSVAGDLSVGAPRPVELLAPKTGSDTSTATAENYADNLEKLNESIEGDTPEGKAARLKVAAASARSITLKETFDRPLVIGYLGFDMKILAGGLLGPPIPSQAVVSGQAQPGDGAFFSQLDATYIAARESTKGWDAARWNAVLTAIDAAPPEGDLQFNGFNRALARWFRDQADKDEAKRRVIQAIAANQR